MERLSDSKSAQVRLCCPIRRWDLGKLVELPCGTVSARNASRGLEVHIQEDCNGALAHEDRMLEVLSLERRAQSGN